MKLKPDDDESMETFPELHTSRLILRKIQAEDIPSLLKYCNDKIISDQIKNIPYPYQEADAIFRMNFILQGFKNRERFVFVISRKDNPELIGEIGLHLDKVNENAQFGYWIAAPFRGQKIAAEAVSALLKFGFEELKLHKIYATHYPDNLASAKVLLNNNLIKEAEMKDHYKVGNEFRTVIQYRLTNAEYRESLAT
ncbi:MAG: GNAT family N-acetyltransferase [Bacteroidia bacterium]